MSNIAVLIDAENVLPAHAEQVFTEAAAAGDIVIREIYGAAPALTSWVEPVLRYAIHPNLTIKASKGKNSSDIALVIGAMDLLVSKGVERVFIVSSDSDFSALSVRLRTAGIRVTGMGTEKANPLWRTACSDFTELTDPAAKQQPAKPAQPARQQAQQPRQQAQPKQQQSQPQQQPAQQQQAKPQAQPQQKAAQQPAQPKSTHAERVAVIRAFLLSQLEAAEEGRLQASALFTALNALPEYKQDQQRSGRKPFNYLMRQFGDVIRSEETSDGHSWFYPAAVPAETAAPGAEQPATAAEPAPAEETAPDADTPQAAPAESAPAGETAAQEAATAEAPTQAETVPAEVTEQPTEAQPEAAAQEEKQEQPQPEKTAQAAWAAIPLKDIGLSPRALGSLKGRGYRTLADVASLTDEELIAMHNVGAKAVEAIRSAAKANV